MIVQIYETGTAAEAAALAAAGVDHIGVLVGDGAFPREQSIAKARAIFAARGSARSVALCLSANLDDIRRIADGLSPDILHLGCAAELLGPAQAAWLRKAYPAIAVMRSIPVIDDTNVALARSYEGIADFLLLDSHRPGDRQIGALGVTHDWALDRRIVESVRTPVVVAGGLGPENVREAIRASHPAGVDSKTCTDTSDGTHRKDIDKVRAFVTAVRAISPSANSS